VILDFGLKKRKIKTKYKIQNPKSKIQNPKSEWL